MRLFTGISVAQEAIPHFAELRAAAHLKWTPAANLHITTKFIGEWPAEGLAELQNALAAIPWPGNLTVTVSAPEFLRGVLVAGISPNPGLSALNNAIEAALEPLGCARETRRYRPHTTLARVGPREIAPLRETIASMRADTASFEATGFHLYLSRPGSLYTKLASYP
ncbi:MAG: RNA 2',3'-cyclic phosphodiesterase [Acidobacteriota bacterium]|nr:RNA 2',3'-cyclic phosphodiesterase [Acidobacteriota bacterium]